MINKIHYCWFGENQKPDLVLKCIKSWKKHFPSFEIIEWNEKNFDVNCNRYVKEAYENKKYAFVSDYARFYILYKYGGLYFDTDVEVIKPFNKLLQEEAFAGFETPQHVAPGLVLWSKNSGNIIMKKMLDLYKDKNFLNVDGTLNMITVVIYFTEVLKGFGLELNNRYQNLGVFSVYPIEYFNPLNDLTGILNKTNNTYSIHWYSKTWMSKKNIFRNKVTRILHRHLGTDFFRKNKGNSMYIIPIISLYI